MKFKITITKDVIDRSLMCGTKENKKTVGDNCAFALAYNQLIPHVWISDTSVVYYNDSNLLFKNISSNQLTPDQKSFIKEFDRLSDTPEKRHELVGRTFEVEIPDKVIEYWYGDAVKAAQKIINSPILQPA